MIDFLGIGAQKCGTTWLYEHLKCHPQVRFPAGKEVHFWDSKQELGVEWWLSLFPDTREIKQGEITPAYGFLDTATIARIKAVAPNLRLMYLMRNPIERAWSAARWTLVRMKIKLEDVSDEWFLDHFASEFSRKRGAYADCINNWLSVFPREQLYLIFFDDILAAPRNVLRSLSRHIGVEPQPFLSQSEAMLRRPVFATEIQAPLSPPLRNQLCEIYAGEIAALETITGRSLCHWINGQPA